MNQISNTRLAAPLVASLLLGACATPPAAIPGIAAPAQYKHAQVLGEGKWKDAAPAEAHDRGEWWKVFGDATLDQLVAEATESNPGLAVAAARLKQARALAGMAAAERLPRLEAQAGAARSRMPQVQRGAATSLQANLGASYEIDLFGRLAAGANAARADASASEGTWRSVMLALQVDVAQSYLALRSLDSELRIASGEIALREKTAALIQRRHELGDLGAADLARARTELSVARAQLHELQRQRAVAENALAVLLGKPASSFRLATTPDEGATQLPVIPAGLPSSLLERRPDVSAAASAVIAAGARVGAARAARFPLLRLTATGGGASADVGEVFKWSARSWALGAWAAVPLFDGGSNRANVNRSEAVLEEATAAYRRVVLDAFAEVEDSLASLRELAAQSLELEYAVENARRSVVLAGSAFDAGSVSYLHLLDAQRALADVERGANRVRRERAATTVALIRALGGGWSAHIHQ